MLLVAALTPGARAATPPRHPAHQHVQLGLLEFLGQSDPTGAGGKSDGGSWMVYLSELNLGATAPARRASAKDKPPAGRAPAKHKASG